MAAPVWPSKTVRYSTGVHISPTVAVVLLCGIANTGIGCGLSNITATAILRQRCGLTDHLCLSIAIEVIHQMLCVMSTGANVIAQVYTPELPSVELVTIKVYGVCLASLTVVLGICGSI